jgi:hypothetical protein
MSGTGSLMIRNLRKPTDYAKAVQTQDELLRIAIANNANIAEARNLIHQGEVPLPNAQDLKDPQQLEQDDAYQEQLALQNLQQLFSYREIGPILAGLTPDAIFVMNQNFPSIKADFTKKFNPKLISPSFFLEYLNKFIIELNASKGVSSNLSFITNKFDTLTDNIEDIRANMPTRQQFNLLSRNLERAFSELPRYIVEPVFQRIEALQQVLPTKEYFDELEKSNDVYRFETLDALQNLTDNMPTQQQLNMLIAEIQSGRLSQREGFDRLEQMVSGVSNDQLSKLEDLRMELSESGKIGINVPFEPEAVANVGVTGVRTLAIGRRIEGGVRQKTTSIYIFNPDTNETILIDTDGLKNLLSTNKEFKQFCIQNGLSSKPTIARLRSYIKGEQERSVRQDEGMSGMTRTTKETTTTGRGLSRGHSIARNGRIVTKHVGSGIDVEVEPLYRQFGKYVINMNQLKNRDILNVKFRSLGRIPQFKPQPISEAFKDFILDLLENGKPNHRVYDTLSVEERQLFEKLATYAGIVNSLKLKKTLTDEDIKDNERFNILRGEYEAGNSSQTLLKELRKLVVKFMNTGKITKTDGTNLLIELSV